MTATLPDWRKLAAAAASDQDDGAVEQAFMQQAYTYLANRAAPILRAPYRLGFEIVYKTDDNSRLVGVFIFRVSNSLFFAPIFWLNGQIKGTDLFYCADEKQFVPLTTEWLDYLISKALKSPGKSVSRDVTAKAPRQVNLWQLAYPPAYQGGAGFSKGSAVLKEVQDTFNEMCEPAQDIKPGVLKEFLKAAGKEAVDAMVSALTNSQEFAANITEVLGAPSEYIPAVEQVKEASVVPGITLHVQPTSDILEKFATTDEQKKRASWLGYLTTDTRPDISKTYEPAEEIFETIQNPGKYKVLMGDGSVESLWVFPVSESADNLGGDSYGCGICPSGCGGTSGDSSTAFTGFDYKGYSRPFNPECSSSHDCLLYDKSNKKFVRSRGKQVWGDTHPEMEKMEGIAGTELKKGKSYFIINESNAVVLKPFKVIDTDKTDAGLTRVCFGDLPWPRPYKEGSRSFLVNPERMDEQYLATMPGDGQSRTFDTRHQFIEVYYPEGKGDEPPDKNEYQLPQPGDKETVLSRVMQAGFGNAKVKRTKMAYVVTTSTRNGVDTWPELNRAQTELRLMAQLGVGCETAAKTMDEVDLKNASSFYYELDVKGASIHPAYTPDFLQYFDDALGVPAEEAQQYRVNTVSPDYTALNPTASRLGDHKKLIETGGDALLSTPSELTDMAQKTDQKAVFEHGAVGQLLKIFDSSGVIEQFLPQLQTGLDRLGRMIFLLYWKPADFAQIYGVDNTQEMENKFISCFKLMGEIVLDLKTKLPQVNGNLQINI